MSSLIDLQNDSNWQRQCLYSHCQQQSGQKRIKKLLNNFLQGLEQSGNIQIIRNKEFSNNFEKYFTTPVFNSGYSFVSNLKYEEETGLLLLKGLLLKEELPLTINTKDLRIASLHFLCQFQRILHFQTAVVNQTNGLISVSFSSFIPEEMGGFSGVLYDAFKNLFVGIVNNNEKFTKLIKQTMNEEVRIKVRKKGDDKNENKMQQVLKYLSLSFIDLSISQSQIQKLVESKQLEERGKILNHVSIDLKQYEIGSSLSLFQNIDIPNLNFSQILIEDQEICLLRDYLRAPQPRLINPSENQYIFNEITIKDNLQKIKMSKTNLKGGTGQMDLAQVKFEYNVQGNNKRCKNSRKHEIVPLQKILLIKKAINMSTEKYIAHEMKILGTLSLAKSAYIIKYYKTSQKCKLQNSLLMDYLPNSPTLHTYLHKNKASISILGKLSLLANITNGLRFLKQHRITHMDLNPNNILVGPHLITKIIDFGQAFTDIHNIIQIKNYEPGFTNPYGPPQSLQRRPHYNSKQDMYSFSIILFKILTNSLPFNPTQKLRQEYKKKNFHNRFMFAVESLNYIWVHKPILLLFSLFIRCNHVHEEFRSYPTWARIVLRIIIQWYRNLF